jgi:hypothetical protein
MLCRRLLRDALIGWGLGGDTRRVRGFGVPLCICRLLQQRRQRHLPRHLRLHPHILIIQHLIDIDQLEYGRLRSINEAVGREVKLVLHGADPFTEEIFRTQTQAQANQSPCPQTPDSPPAS